MDPFQLRLECLALVRRLTASQQSIAKVVDFAAKQATSAADDIWDCILGECQKTSLNARLNILFLIDALLLSVIDPSGVSSSSATTGTQSSASSSRVDVALAATTYAQKAVRDLATIVDAVVPQDSWDAVRLNASSTQKVLASWKLLGVFEGPQLELQQENLQERKDELSTLSSAPKHTFSRNDVLRRIEEDRERHKRLRERAWILPAKTYANALLPRANRVVGAKSPSSISSKPRIEARTSARDHTANSRAPDALDVDFDNTWETTSDLNDDDFDQMREEDTVWWGGERFSEKQRAQAAAAESSSQAEPLISETNAYEAEGRAVGVDAGEAAHLVPERKRRASPKNDGRGGDDSSGNRDREPRSGGSATSAPNRWRPIGSFARNGGGGGGGGGATKAAPTDGYRHATSPRDAGWRSRDAESHRDRDRSDRGRNWRSFERSRH